MLRRRINICSFPLSLEIHALVRSYRRTFIHLPAERYIHAYFNRVLIYLHSTRDLCMPSHPYSRFHFPPFQSDFGLRSEARYLPVASAQACICVRSAGLVVVGNEHTARCEACYPAGKDQANQQTGVPAFVFMYVDTSCVHVHLQGNLCFRTFCADFISAHRFVRVCTAELPWHGNCLAARRVPGIHGRGRQGAGGLVPAATRG